MPLKVYKSSAGSGKTATLVFEYLKICIPKPLEFKHTLAITFTNKAAGEMKSRIIETLELATNQKTNFLLDKLKTDLNLNDEEIQEASRKLLFLIVHNYDEFAVSTIDSFVHRVVRTFANEVKLPANFEVVLDSDDIIPEIVDELFDKVGNDKEFTGILLSFVMKQIEEEKNHDLGRMLADFVAYNFGEEVFAQKKYLQTFELSDFPPLIKRLRKKQSNLKAKIEQLAESAIKLFSSVSLTMDDLSNKKSGIYGYFNNLLQLNDDSKLFPNKTSLKAIEQDKWLPLKAGSAQVAAMEQIKIQVISIFNTIAETAPEYLLLKQINSRIYSLALTKEIQYLLTNFMERSSKVHISEFNKKISESIAGQPIPFLYERLGFKYRHFLIDEFQDTSVLQWHNLLPLVEESLANNNFNMLVGDAKQAIYRFRSGEVELFTSLPKIFNSNDSPLERSREQLLAAHYREEVLGTNYRSNKHIVEFNNDFFSLLLEQESERFKINYKGLHQQIQNLNPGFVKLETLEAENAAAYSENRLPLIEKFIKEVIQAGYGPGDICILCRSKKQIHQIVSYLIPIGYKLVSSESLLIASSPKVSLLISFLRLLVRQENKLQFAEFLFKLKDIDSNKYSELNISQMLKTKVDYPLTALNLMNSSQNIENILELSVYEICEFAIRQFNFNQTADAFIQFFLNFVFSAQSSGKYSLIDFLELWDKKKEKIFVEMPDDSDAIKIMTAHKSKGLDFKVVIADLYSSRKSGSSEFWTDVNIEGEEKLKRTMLPMTKIISEIGFEDIYEQEQEKNRLDFLNLVYVAFTRASKVLFAIGKDSRDDFGTLLNNYITQKGDTNKEQRFYEYGTLKNTEDNGSADTIEKQFTLRTTLSTDWKEIIKIAEAEEIFWLEKDFSKASSFGTLVHKILSTINFTDQIENALNNYLVSGLIDKTEQNGILKMIKKLVEHPLLKRYYSREVRVKNESELIDRYGNSIRPDRVVIDHKELIIIDYKTGKKDEENLTQIQNYANAFADIGFENIKCFLVYLGKEIVVEEIKPMITLVQ